MCVPKSVTPSRIQENLQVFDFSLSDDDVGLISSFNRNERFIVPTVEVRRAAPAGLTGDPPWLEHQPWNCPESALF